MLFLEFFKWWYGAGWAQAAKGAVGLVKKVELSFSISVLLKTLFSPWKRIITIPGRALEDKLSAMLDNLVSRTVGFFVRIFSLVTAVLLMTIASVVGVVIAISWPLIPFLIVLSVIKAVL
jgi:phage-related minor tail protein